MKLIIVVKKKYFDEIYNGKKHEEFRLITPYWMNRLIERCYDGIVFKNGYDSSAKTFETEYLGYTLKNIKHEHFGSKSVKVFAIKIGKRITK